MNEERVSFPYSSAFSSVNERELRALRCLQRHITMGNNQTGGDISAAADGVKEYFGQFEQQSASSRYHQPPQTR